MGRVFVGHVGRDAAFAEALAARLATLAWPVADDLVGADAAVFVVTPAAVATSGWRDELERARRLRIRVVAVTRIAVPEDELPDGIPRPIRFEAGSDAEAGVAAVLSALGPVPVATAPPAGEPAPPAGEPAPPEAAPTRRGRRLLVPAIGFAVVALVAAAALASRRGGDGGVARSRQLAAASAAVLTADPPRAMALASAAVRMSPTRDAMFALRQAIDASPLLGRLPAVGPQPVSEGPGISWSPDGGRLAIGGVDGTVRVCQIGPHGRCRTIAAAQAAPLVAFSPDGLLLAVAGDAGARVLDLRTGDVRVELHAPGHPHQLAWTPDGSAVWLANGAAVDRLVVAPDVAGPSAAAIARLRATGPGMTNVAVRPDGRRLLISGRGRLVVVDANSGRTVRTLATGGVVTASAYSPDGRLIVAAQSPNLPESYRRGAIRVYDARSLTLVRTLDLASAFALSPDGRSLAFGTPDAAAGVVDLASGRPLVTFPAQTAAIVQVAFSPDGSRVATAAADGRVLVWRAGRGERAVVPLDADGVDGLTFSTGVAVALRRAGRAVVETFATGGGRAETPLDVGPDQGTFMRLAGDTVIAGAPILGTSAVPVLHAWAVRYHRLIGRFTVPDGAEAPAVSNDGRLIAYTSGRSGAVVVQDAAGATIAMQPMPRCGGAVAFAFAPDAATLTGRDRCGDLAIWETRTGVILHPLLRRVSAAWYSPGGGLLGVVRPHGDVAVLDVRRWSVLATMPGRGSGVNGLAFSPDDSMLAAAGGDGTVRIWDAPTGDPLRVLHPVVPVGVVAFSADGRELATLDADGGALRIWDACPGCRDPGALLADAATH